MTSSLVGSEMCIRDSTPFLRVSPFVHVSQKAACVELFPWSQVAQTKEAVSYTHLTLPTICSV
eukprot:1092559-Prorocentrum_lima.AAC.1